MIQETDAVGVSAEDEKYRKDVEDYKQHLYEMNRKTQEELDKNLITLSTVMIGFGLTVRQQLFASDDQLGFPLLLRLSIGSLVICIATILISLRIGMTINEKMIDEIEKDGELDKVFKSTRYIRWLNAASSWAFFIGLVLVILFAWYGASGSIR